MLHSQDQCRLLTLNDSHTAMTSARIFGFFYILRLNIHIAWFVKQTTDDLPLIIVVNVNHRRSHHRWNRCSSIPLFRIQSTVYLYSPHDSAGRRRTRSCRGVYSPNANVHSSHNNAVPCFPSREKENQFELRSHRGVRTMLSCKFTRRSRRKLEKLSLIQFRNFSKRRVFVSFGLQIRNHSCVIKCKQFV